jgi:hypothetical protein
LRLWLKQHFIFKKLPAEDFGPEIANRTQKFNFIHAYKMKEHKHHSMGGLADLSAFSTKPSRPPRSSNTLRPARAHLNFLLAILDLF